MVSVLLNREHGTRALYQFRRVISVTRSERLFGYTGWFHPWYPVEAMFLSPSPKDQALAAEKYGEGARAGCVGEEFDLPETVSNALFWNPEGDLCVLPHV